jgi:hypothetical protein
MDDMGQCSQTFSELSGVGMHTLMHTLHSSLPVFSPNQLQCAYALPFSRGRHEEQLELRVDQPVSSWNT